MLKVAIDTEEKLGGLLMTWWDGQGAAQVFAHEDDALLMERAEGTNSLVDMVRSGRDDEASRLICRVVAELHAPRPMHGGRPASGSCSACTMVQGSGAGCGEAWRNFDRVRGNGARTAGIGAGGGGVAWRHPPRQYSRLRSSRWLAIDPKGLIGERGFDYANLFCNPEAEIATAPGRLARQVDVVAEAAGLERRRLLKWIMAYAGLSAAWFLGDGEWEPAKTPLAVAELAAAELARTAS